MRYPKDLDYQGRRRHRRARIKRRLLVILRRLEARDDRPDMAALAIKFGCGVSTLRAMRHELAEEGAIVHGVDEPNEAGMVPDLAERVAKVREAKIAKRDRERETALTKAELKEVLP